MAGWPEPEPGLVICYSYLWRHEQDAGRDEGVKDRPCAIVVALSGKEHGRPTVIVLPITHTLPQAPAEGIELPATTKHRLGLDGERSWVVTSEANSFLWPGPDLRFLPGSGPESAAYGLLPPELFRVVQASFLARIRAKQVGLAQRT